jgi:hypothetical protein
MRLTPVVLTILIVISAAMSSSAKPGSRHKASHMLGKEFFWESDASTWDTTQWRVVQGLAGIDPSDSSARSPKTRTLGYGSLLQTLSHCDILLV